MALDGISAGYLAHEFERRLTGARINRIFQPARYDLILHLRFPGRQEMLYLSANPSMPTAYLRENAGSNPKDAPAFCMLLRKHLIGGEIIAVTQPECERIFRFTIKCRNEMGDFVNKILVAELMGRHSNLMLLREDGIIHDAIRHIDHSVNRMREMMPARPYIDPPAQDKLTVSLLRQEYHEAADPDHIFAFMKKGSDYRTVFDLLMDQLAGFSPLLVREVLHRAMLREDLSPLELKESDFVRLSHELSALLEKVSRLEGRPALYYVSEKDSRPYDFHAVPLTLFQHRKTFSSLSAAMEAFFDGKLAKQAFEQKKRELEKQLRHLLKQSQRKSDLHEADLREGEKAEQYRLFGELLQSKVYTLKDKADEITVENYYDENLTPVTIPLNPALSPAQNIDFYFKRYRKAKQKLTLAAAFLAEDQAEQEWLASLFTALDTAEDRDDLRAVEDEMKAVKRREKITASEEQPDIPVKQILNPGKPGKNKKKKYKVPEHAKGSRKSVKSQEQVPVHSFRSYRSSTGKLIRSGRNNIENERLSLRKSRKDDLWFHARNIPGSHVVLHLDGREADPHSIEEAAMLAAWFSSANKARSGNKVEVDYCPVRNLSKIKGSKPGHLQYKDFSTVYVEAKNPVDYLTKADHSEEDNE